VTVKKTWWPHCDPCRSSKYCAYGSDHPCRRKTHPYMSLKWLQIYSAFPYFRKVHIPRKYLSPNCNPSHSPVFSKCQESREHYITVVMATNKFLTAHHMKMQKFTTIESSQMIVQW